MPTPSRNDIYEAVIRKMVTQALEEQETIFEQEHICDTNQALVGYVKSSARELGYSPRYKEIIGWRMIEERFGSWNQALQEANLTPAAKCSVTKLPRIVEETEKQKEIYRQRKAEKKLRNRQRLQEQERKKKENAKVYEWRYFRLLPEHCRTLRRSRLHTDLRRGEYDSDHWRRLPGKT